jgi:hypothetical protein
LKSPAELSLGSVFVRALGAAGLIALFGAILAARAAADQATPPDGPTASALLEQFRRSIWVEPIYAEFDLRQMPRRGSERLYRGRFWGGRNERGPVTRLELDVGKGGFTHRFLVQGGPDGAMWTSDGSAEGVPGDGAVLVPLVPGVEMTPFDILPMPYLYWLDTELTGVERIRGRRIFTCLCHPLTSPQGTRP